MSRLTSAITLANDAHVNQIDEDGQPHIIHCMEVMFRVRDYVEADIVQARHALLPYSLEDMMCAAVLHDTVEDTYVTLDLIRVQFGKDVADLVDGVTRRGLGKNETKEFYRDFIYRAKQNPGCHIIKISDLQHNLSRCPKIKKESWRNKLLFKYATAEAVLNNDDQPTWEQASASVQYGTLETLYFIADPNGKKITVSETEWKTLTGKK